MGKPFINWIGGKRRLAKDIIPRIPMSYDRYVEPFLGGGAIFFHLRPKEALLSDVNDELIDTYRAIREEPWGVIKELERIKYLRDTHGERFYLQILNDYSPKCEIKRAARFIFLSKLSFRSIMAGNRKQNLGVYYFKKIFDVDNILDCHRCLIEGGVYLEKCSYKDIHVGKGDFVYLDPPYLGQGQRMYKHKFTLKDHVKLAEWCKRIHDNGVKFMLSNSYYKESVDLYSDFRQITLDKFDHMKTLGSGYTGGKELLVRNY